MFSLITGLFSLPSIISSALNFFSPVVSGVTAFAKWYLSEMWDGLKTIFSNLSTLVVIGTIIILTLLYGINTAECAINPVFPDSSFDPSIPWRYDWNR